MLDLLKSSIYLNELGLYDIIMDYYVDPDSMIVFIYDYIHILIPYLSEDLEVDWGDGWLTKGVNTHIYQCFGEYRVTIISGRRGFEKTNKFNSMLEVIPDNDDMFPFVFYHYKVNCGKLQCGSD